MNQNETKAVNLFIEEALGRLKLFKVENKIPGPMPDMVGENREGEAFWLEAKYIEAWPKRETTCPLNGAFQRGQQAWSRSWLSWGGNAFCLLSIGKGRGREWWLIKFTQDDLEKMTRGELENVKLAEGIENITLFLETL